jgi:hypothetical protein
MRHATPAEERTLALVGAIDELVDQHGGNSSLNEPQADNEIRSVTPARFNTSILAR